ncbi:MAG TPA: HdeD family acid-resistance protein [Chthoniobacterales bacterium]|nr:HdeD family acid-resistance protein [Chthoniobacterales bacterium]
MNGTGNMQTGEATTMVHTLKLNWWLLALRGLVAVLFGVLAFMWPGATLITLVWLFGAFALVNGILSLVLAAKTPKGYPKVGSLILGGLLGVLAGLLAFVMPGITALGLLILIAAWAIATGVMELVAAVRLRKTINNEWLLVLAGIASIVFGVLLLFQPGAGALALIWLIGAWAVVFGILLMILAFRMRNWKGFIAVGTAGA